LGGRKFSLTVYVLVVFALSWPFQFASAVLGKWILALNVSSMVMVGVATFLLGRFYFRNGFRGAGWGWGRPIHYVGVIGFVLLLWVVPVALELVMGHARWPEQFANSLTPVPMVYLPVVYLVGGFGEEFGWRGYMLPRIAERFTPRWAVLIHGLIWWAWHLPIVAGMLARLGAAQGEQMHLPPVITGVALAVIGSAMSLIPVVLHAVVFAYFWMRSKSLVVATVYHAAFDGLRDGLGATGLLTPLAGGWANLVIVVFGVLLLWREDWSRLRIPPSPSPSPPGNA
jgi:membrane protease YdiL (CAAX protease family)